MIALDTNLLVHAHRIDSDLHELALTRVKELAESGSPWAVPWPCVHEFLAVVTNSRTWVQPSTLLEAIRQIDAWMGSPRLSLLAEGPTHWERLRQLSESGRCRGGLVHDARIAAICLEHGVSELWTLDRDFGRFPSLKTVNPLVAT